MKNPPIHSILQQSFCLIFFLALLSSCIREEEYANDPQGNFEQLWKIIDRQYCFLDYKQIDWDDIYTQYQKRITPNMSNEGLFEVLSEMLYELQDGHVNLASAHNVSYYDAWYQDYPVTSVQTWLKIPIWAVPVRTIVRQQASNIRY